MITLEKLAGFQEEDLVLDKVAEAMDFLEANGVPAIDGLTALVNIDGEGMVADEKVAGYVENLDAYQIDALAKVAEYLGDEDPSEVAAAALEVADEAENILKVAEAMDYLEANGIDSTAGFIIAGNVTPEGYFADEKVASTVIEDGFTDADFDKIAEAVEFLGENGISLDEAVLSSEILKEAGFGDTMSRLGRRARGTLRSYVGALTGRGSAAAKETRDALEEKVRSLKATVNNPDVNKMHKTIVGRSIPENERALAEANAKLKRIRTRQAKAIAGTAAAGAAGVYGYHKLRN